MIRCSHSDSHLTKFVKMSKNWFWKQMQIQCQLCQSLAVGFQADYLTSLSLRFLLCKIEPISWGIEPGT